MASSVDGVAFPVTLPDLPSSWEYALLGDLVEDRGICYGIVQPGTVSEEGTPVIRVNNVRNGRIDASDVLKVDPAVEAKFQRSRLRGGEVLLTLVGTLGEVAIVPDTMSGWNVARAVGVLPVRKDPGSSWVAICLRSALCQHCMRSWATTTVQATFNLRDVANLPIPLPPARLREKITHILGTLDDKIELNRRTNATLEGISRAIFKSWFVDFDPVRQKAAGKQAVGIDAQTAALFPDSFEDSEIGEVPSGWRVAPLDEVADYLNGLALQKYPAGDGPTLPVIKIAQLRKGDATDADRCNDTVPAEYVIEDGDVLFSWSGSLEVVVWCGGRGALNQHLFKVTSKSFPKWFYYLWTLHHLADFRLIAADKATTMGHIQRKHLTAATVVVPPARCIDGMTRTMEPLLRQSIRASKECRTLAALRDALLPKLLSGEIRVPEAEQAVEVAIG